MQFFQPSFLCAARGLLKFDMNEVFLAFLTVKEIEGHMGADIVLGIKCDFLIETAFIEGVSYAYIEKRPEDFQD